MKRSSSTHASQRVLILAIPFFLAAAIPVFLVFASSKVENSLLKRELQIGTLNKGIISPQGNTIIVNGTPDAVNSTDGLCSLREAITAANNNTASGSSPGERQWIVGTTRQVQPMKPEPPMGISWQGLC